MPKSIFLALLAMTAGALGQMTINGAGATFPDPIYSKWFDAYTKVDGSVRFNYQPIGSGGGQKQISERTVDFGASDGPMSDESLAKAHGHLLHLPTVAGAVAVAYQLPGIAALQLDGEALARIFLGQITRWDDPALALLNPGVRLPKAEVVVVHRSDGSGTSQIWTDYLSAVSPAWKSQVGKGTSVRWPVGIGARGNERVTGQVKQLPGAIGYVELSYAVQNHLAVATVRNKAGVFVAPSVPSVAAALAEAQIPDDFRFSMVDAEGAEAYPIAGMTWLLVYAQQTDPAKGQKLVEFLRWMLRDGEKMAANLQYAPLPPELQQRVLARVETIR